MRSSDRSAFSLGQSDAVCQSRLFPFGEMYFRYSKTGSRAATVAGARPREPVWATRRPGALQNTPIDSPAARASPSSSDRSKSAGVISLRTISASATFFQP